MVKFQNIRAKQVIIKTFRKQKTKNYPIMKKENGYQSDTKFF